MQQVMANFPVLAPLLALAIGALVVLVLDLILPARAARPWWIAASLGACGLAIAYTAGLWGQNLKAFGGGFLADNFSLSFLLLSAGTGIATVLLSLNRTEEDQSGYLALMLWAAMGMGVLAGAGSLMTVFLGLEILSLALYVLVAFAPGRVAGWEAALKYFVLGAVAAGFLLFGFALLYGTTGSMDLAAIATWVAQAQGELPLYFKVGAGLALAGYAFKLALVPFHVWVPDVYEGAPAAVTSFMSVGTKAAAFAALARFLLAVAPAGKAGAFLLPLTVLAALSMLVGALGALKQTSLKRILAYSGIAHAGYLIMALPGLTEGLAAGTFYLFAYLFMNTGAFAVLLYLDSQGEDGADLNTYAGLFYRKPALAAAMSLFLFALAGLPPTGGFTGKFALAVAAGKAGAWFLLGVLILTTGISAYVYLKVILLMLRKAEGAASRKLGAGLPAAGGIAAAQDSGPLALPRATVAAGTQVVTVLCAIGTLLLGVAPGLLLNAFGRLIP